MRRSIAVLLAVTLGVFMASALVGQAQQQPRVRGWQIPVIINLYPGCGVTPEKARRAVEEANKVLAQAGEKLVIVKVNDPPGPGNGDNNGDGNFTRPERDDARTYGGRELDSLPNKRGIKISFANQVKSENPNVVGVSIHRNPTIIVKDQCDVNTGKTIAHELGHVQTLGPGHQIDDNTWADGEGHADPNKPGPSGNDNLMRPTVCGTELTLWQILEMWKWKAAVAKCAVQWELFYPATKYPIQHGSITDARGDNSGMHGIYDLDRVVLTSLAVSDSINIQITVADLLPDTGTVQVEYWLLLDIDANPATGM